MLRRLAAAVAAAVARRIAPFGGCARCGWPWGVRVEHETPLYLGHLAPLCEPCWRALEPAGRWPFYAALLADADRYHRKHGRPGVPALAVEDAKAAVMAGL